MPRRVALLCPTAWDARQLEAARDGWAGWAEPLLLGPADEDVPADLDVFDLVERAVRGHGATLGGATSSSDYPGAAAAALLAERLGRPGPEPQAVLEAGHKWLARARQRAVAPEATPWTRLLDPLEPPAGPEGLAFPCFVKPVRGAFSVLARPVPGLAALHAFLAHPDVHEHGRTTVRIQRALQARLSPGAPDPRCFVAEGLLAGLQVTVEGWIQGGRVGVLGVVDSLLHPGTHAFARFEAPSALPAPVQERLCALAARVVAGSGLDDACWNLEAIVAPDGALHVVELNPRLAGQFSDLWAKLTGVSGHERALRLALGLELPAAGGRGAFPFAASVPLRTFEPVGVERAPSAARVLEVERAFPGTLVWWECREGERLVGVDRAGEGQGLRYAVVNVGARTREGLEATAQAVVEALGARLVPLAGDGGAERDGP